MNPCTGTEALYRAVWPIGGLEVWLYSFLTTALEGGEGSASCPGCSLPQGKTRYASYRSLGGPQSRFGQVQKISPPTGIRFPDRPARSQSLYRLSYPAHKRRMEVMVLPIIRLLFFNSPVTSLTLLRQ